MFTGIVTAVGRILEAEPLGSGAGFGRSLTIETPPSRGGGSGFLDGVIVGDSIALSGACMTVTGLDPAARRFRVEVSAESLARTAGLDGPGEVNLEKALRADGRLDGHLMSGHVDGTGVVTGATAVGESIELRIAASRELAPFLAVKGSIAVDGTSLTVNGVDDRADACEFTINVIAHTAKETTLGGYAPGRRVNLEIDTVARYVQRMLGVERARRQAAADPAS